MGKELKINKNLESWELKYNLKTENCLLKNSICLGLNKVYRIIYRAL